MALMSATKVPDNYFIWLPTALSGGEDNLFGHCPGRTAVTPYKKQTRTATCRGGVEATLVVVDHVLCKLAMFSKHQAGTSEGLKSGTIL